MEKNVPVTKWAKNKLGVKLWNLSKYNFIKLGA